MFLIRHLGLQKWLIYKVHTQELVGVALDLALGWKLCSNPDGSMFVFQDTPQLYDVDKLFRHRLFQDREADLVDQRRLRASHSVPWALTM